MILNRTVSWVFLNLNLYKCLRNLSKIFAINSDRKVKNLFLGSVLINKYHNYPIYSKTICLAINQSTLLLYAHQGCDKKKYQGQSIKTFFNAIFYGVAILKHIIVLWDLSFNLDEITGIYKNFTWAWPTRGQFKRFLPSMFFSSLNLPIWASDWHVKKHFRIWLRIRRDMFSKVC